MPLRSDLQVNLLNFQIALEAIVANKLRALLTALGIIFGVSAVIAMLAIGKGAQEEILKQIKLVGVNNIVIKPIEAEKKEKQSNEDTQSSAKEKKKFSPGLTLLDALAIQQQIPTVLKVSPEIVLSHEVLANGIAMQLKLVGITPDFFQVYNLRLSSGNMFDSIQVQNGLPVCIIGQQVQHKLFSKENPIGKRLKCGSNWLTVIGVLESRAGSETAAASSIGVRSYNLDVYTPIKTVLLRYRNRDLVTARSLKSTEEFDFGDESVVTSRKGSAENYHQLDRIVVQVSDSRYLSATADILMRMLKRRHNSVKDVEATIPEELLKQQQRTKDIFNMVLAAIAGISLLVGGIGIMNIMLASILERIKEIGIRLSIGATKRDIVAQFLCEAVLISLSGGIIGILFGLILSALVAKFTDIPTIISISSIVISFGVSVSVGLVFGIMPARRAALQDPVNSLRHE